MFGLSEHVYIIGHNMHLVKPLILFRLILLIGVAVLPFVYWPSAQISFEIPRVYYVHRLIEVMTVLGIAAYYATKKPIVKLSQIVLVIGFILFVSLSALFGTDVPKSLLGNTYRGDGLITLWRFGGMIFLIALLFQPQWRNALVRAISVGSVGVSILTVISIGLNFLSISFFPPWFGKYGTTFGQPNFLAGYLAITFPFLWYLYRQSSYRFKPLITIGIITQTIALVATRSWGALLATALGMGILILRKHKRLSTFYKPLMICIVGGIIVCASIVWFEKNRLPASVNAESRQRIFIKLSLAAFQKPFIGWGWANVDHAFQSVDWPYKFTQDVYVDKAHSTMLEVLVTTGIFGFMIYIGVLANSFRLIHSSYLSTDQNKDWWTTMGICLLIYVVHSQTNVVGIAEEYIFWLLIGLTLQQPTKIQIKSKRLRQ